MIANRLPERASLTLAQRSNLIPMTAALYDTWRERSLSLLTGEPYGLEREFGLMLEWLAVRPGQTFLDVGTSTGNYAETLARAGGTVTAIDIAMPMLERARGRLRAREPGLEAAVTFEAANAEALPYADASFDGVVIGATMNEFHSTARALAECARVLKPGGKLFAMYLCESDSGPGRAIQALFKLTQIRFPSRESVRLALEGHDLHRQRAEVRRAVAFELFVKERRDRATEQDAIRSLGGPVGKPQRQPLE